ncbi:hypothetical protein AB9F31_17100, partial [Escherichia coli]
RPLNKTKGCLIANFATVPLFLDQTLSALQIIGVLLVIGSIWLGQRSNRTPRARIACRKSP